MINKIKQSLSLKIVLVLLILSSLGLFASWIYATQTAQKDVIKYYNNSVNTFSSVIESRVKEILSNPEVADDEMKTLADGMQELCKKNNIYAVYIDKIYERDPQSFEMKGSVLMWVTADEVFLEGVDGYYESFEVGKNALEKLGDNENGFYYLLETQDGSLATFVHLFEYIDAKSGEKIEVANCLSIPLTFFDSLVDELMLRLFMVMSGLVLLIIFVVGIVVQRGAVLPFITLSNSMIGFLSEGDMDFKPLKVSGTDERAKVSEAFNFMAEEIIKHVESVKEYESERQKSLAESAIAADIQKGLLPKDTYIRRPFVVKGYMNPAKYIGGDIYYYERIGTEKIAFAIGDVSGKGVSAALFMAKAVSAIRYGLQNYESPAKALEQINIDMCVNNPNKLFVTLFVGVLDAGNNRLIYSNAGHNPPFLLGGELRVLSEARGLLAGLFIDETYEDAEVAFDKNDQLFLYTDGVTEAVNEKKERFGDMRLKNILRSNHNGLLQEVVSKVQKFSGEADQFDDITIMTVGLISDQAVLAASKEAIPALKDFIMNNDNIPEKDRKKVYLACEEIFVNIYSYGYPDKDPGEVWIEVSSDDIQFSITIMDDGKAFDPLESQIDIDEYDIDNDIGGLGRYIAFNIMDDVSYSYENEKNVIVLKKKKQEKRK